MSSPNSSADDDSGLDPASSRMFRRVRRERERKEAYRRRGEPSVWSVVGTMGMVGWGVVLPPVLGGFLGRYLDGRWGTRPHLTGLFLVVGLALGCWNTWRMVNRERSE